MNLPTKQHSVTLTPDMREFAERYRKERGLKSLGAGLQNLIAEAIEARYKVKIDLPAWGNATRFKK